MLIKNEILMTLIRVLLNLVPIYQMFILQKELQLVGVDIHKLKLKCFYLKQRLGENLIIFII